MSSWDVNFAFERFQEYRHVMEAACGSNESATRLRAIDTMLFDVLGWDKTLVEPEKYVRAVGFADYVLLPQKVPLGVIEAKREEATFVLKGASYTREPTGLPLLLKESKEAADALNQATGYASNLGAPYVAITNGFQYIVALAFVAGVPVERRSALVFESLDAISARFRDFFDVLCPAGLQENALAMRLADSRRAPAPTKLCSSIVGYPRPIERNVLVNEIAWVLSIVWDKTNEGGADEDFLRQCYVRTDSTKSALDLGKEIIEERATHEDRSVHVHDQSNALDVFQEPRPERPIIVLGRVGHGKSTFLDYLRQIEAKKELDGYVQVEIDFKVKPATVGEIQDYVIDSFDDQIVHRYDIDLFEAKFARAALDGELRRFRKTVRGSKHPEGSPEQLEIEGTYIEEHQSNRFRYLTAAVRHLRRSHHKSIAVFFDNLDRRDDPIQEEAFRVASALASDWEALLFVCLRPGTFHRSSAFGTLDTVAPRTILVQPPRTDVVLTKRFELAAEVAEGTSNRARTLSAATYGRNMSAELPTAAEFFKCCRESFASNRALNAVFAAVSRGDIRTLLRYVREYLTSRHLDTKKIVEKYRSSSGYRLAEHEAIRALLYGEYRDYDPSQSAFPNLFDVEHADGAEHFARMCGLHCLERQTDTAPNHGFVPADAAIEYLNLVGFGDSTARNTVSWMLKSKCAEDRFGESAEQSQPDEIRITSLGRFLLSNLAGSFAYIDAIIVDTPICDDSVRAKIVDAAAIRGRIERGKIFGDYLEKCSAQLRDNEARQCWARIKSALDADIRRAEESLGRGQ